MTEVLGATPAENLDMIADSVGFIADHGREAVYDAEHFFDGYRADRDYALATLRAARDAGARTLVLCDTNGGTLTDELVRILGDVRGSLEGDAGRARGHLGHPHPQRRRARGRELDRGRPGGRPPRPGHDQRLRRALRQREHGLDPRQPRAQDAEHALTPPGGGDLAALTELSPRPSRRSPTRTPTTTSRTSAGRRSPTRAASTARPWPRSSAATSTWTRRAVGNAGRLVVSELGGRANTSIRARQLGHELEGVRRRRGSCRKLIKRLENEGLAFEGAEASFELLIRRHAPDYAAPFRIVDYTCLVEQRSGRELLAEATVKVEVAGEVLHTAADGNGPVNALDGALRKALRRVLPGARRRPPRGLQGAHPRRGDRDGGPHARHHRLAGRLDDLEHDGQRHQHHRGVRAGAGGLAGVRDLEVRRRAAPARRAPLHDHQRPGDGGGRAREPDPAAAGGTA